MKQGDQYLKSIEHALKTDNVDLLIEYEVGLSKWIKDGDGYLVNTHRYCIKTANGKCWNYLANKVAGSLIELVNMACMAIMNASPKKLDVVLRLSFNTCVHEFLIQELWSRREDYVPFIEYIHRSTPLPIIIKDLCTKGVNHKLRNFSLDIESSKKTARKNACMVMFCKDKTLIDLDLLPLLSRAIMTFW